MPDDEKSILATDRTTVEEEFSLEPTDAGPEEPAWLEEAHEEIAAEHDDQRRVRPLRSVAVNLNQFIG